MFSKIPQNALGGADAKSQRVANFPEFSKKFTPGNRVISGVSSFRENRKRFLLIYGDLNAADCIPMGGTHRRMSQSIGLHRKSQAAARVYKNLQEPIGSHVKKLESIASRRNPCEPTGFHGSP